MATKDLVVSSVILSCIMRDGVVKRDNAEYSFECRWCGNGVDTASPHICAGGPFFEW
jgi:hypothetical protein